MGASGDKSRCSGREGRVSSPGKEDDGADEARGRDARLLVRRRGCETSISSSGRRGLGRRSGMVEDGGDGCGGGQR